MKFQHIVVATDLSEPAREGYPHAASWARQFGGKVTVLYCESNAEKLASMPLDDSAAVVDAATRKRNEALAKAKADIEQYGATAEIAVIGGDPKRAIPEFLASSGADLLVMTKHSRFLERLRKLGSTTARVLRLSPIPVLVIHTGDSPMAPTHVMVAHDVTEGSADGLQAALSVAEAWQARVTAVHAVDRHGAVSLFGADLPATLPSADELVNYYQDVLVDHLGDGTKHAVHAKVAGELPVGEALAAAADQIKADLIAIPAVSRNALELVLLGSTTEQVCTHAHVPVFVMPRAWLDPDDVDRVMPVEPTGAS